MAMVHGCGGNGRLLHLGRGWNVCVRWSPGHSRLRVESGMVHLVGRWWQVSWDMRVTVRNIGGMLVAMRRPCSRRHPWVVHVYLAHSMERVLSEAVGCGSAALHACARLASSHVLISTHRERRRKASRPLREGFKAIFG